MDCKLSAKRNGKWWSYGALKTDEKYGNLRVSFKITPELKELVNCSDGWINFSVFENDKKEKQAPAARDDLDDSIPF